MITRAYLLLVFVIPASMQVLAQTPVVNPDELLGQQNAITTAVPFLAISPDARHAALGDAGVATSPDANSSYWNPAKLAFIDQKYGGTVSYTPWLGKIIGDMSISYLSGFYKITREQAVSFSMKYFDLGEITFNQGPGQGDILGNFNPREFAFDASYSRMLSENLSLGLTGRFIHSNLTGAFNTGGVDAKPGNSVATDIGIFYTKDLQSARNANLSLGASITNIGAKLSYTDNANRDFIPTNLRIGSAFTTELDPYNSITFVLDFNKLLVPTPPVRDGDGNIVAGRDSRDRSLLSGMFTSFGDAPNGAREEFQEIMTSAGIEYWYNQTFAARVGYFNEAQNKGNRKYMTIGLGFRKDIFGFDVAYLVPTNRREHPLAETIRYTLIFQFRESKRDLKESVTD